MVAITTSARVLHNRLVEHHKAYGKRRKTVQLTVQLAVVTGGQHAGSPACNTALFGKNTTLLNTSTAQRRHHGRHQSYLLPSLPLLPRVLTHTAYIAEYQQLFHMCKLGSRVNSTSRPDAMTCRLT